MRARLARHLGAVLVVGAVQAAPAVAQEQSVGMMVSPWLRLHDESTCCVGIGAWLQHGRFQIDYEVGLNVWHARDAASLDQPEHLPLEVVGWAATASLDLMTWRTPRTATRFRAGLTHRRNARSTDYAPGVYILSEGWTVNVSLAVDFLMVGSGRPFLRTGLRGIFPEPNVGIGFPF